MTDAVDIAVFAKAPVAGYAKTRLIPALGARGAARMQRRLLQQTVRTALAAELGGVTLWCAPDVGHRAFRALRSAFGVVCLPQSEGDLGERMAQAFAHCAGQRPLLLIGCDCPELSPAHLRDCADALRAGSDAVLLPAEDGGYVLIGLAAPRPEVFAGIRWSTPSVLAQTRIRLAEACLHWSEGPTLRDLDRPEDLARFQRLQPAEGISA